MFKKRYKVLVGYFPDVDCIYGIYDNESLCIISTYRSVFIAEFISMILNMKNIIFKK